jgi:hypothetical protein
LDGVLIGHDVDLQLSAISLGAFHTTFAVRNSGDL